jgi:hypothetical protein
MKKLLLLPALVLSMHLGATKQEVKLEAMLKPKSTEQAKPDVKQKSFFARHFGKFVAANVINIIGHNLLCGTANGKPGNPNISQLILNHTVSRAPSMYRFLTDSLNLASSYAIYKKIESLDPEVK